VFAFGGIYPSTLAVPVLLLAMLAIRYRHGLVEGGPGGRGALDHAVLVAVAAAVVQIVPLPRTAIASIAPAGDHVAAMLSIAGAGAGASLPISIDPSGSVAATALFAGAVLLFAVARRIFCRGGVRTTARLVAGIGLVLSAVALAQNATAHGLIYWRWAPADVGPEPFGPFVNRNHFATWTMMAVPLAVGYLIAHTLTHHRPDRAADWRSRLVEALDGRAAVLIAGAVLMIAATAACLSRSGLVGLSAAIVCGALLARRRGARARAVSSRLTAFLAVLAVAAGTAVMTQVGPGALGARFGAAPGAVAYRLTIWHDTLAVLRDFWLTGTGLGTFPTVMILYQRSNPGLLFNQAHNHYLQLAAEGGLLVGLPVFAALVCFVRAAWRSIDADRSSIFWLRAGAASGLVGVAVQSVWETGLTAPANAALAAVLAAIVVHVPAPRPARPRSV
jgi:O-antigen ligase